MKQLKMMLLSGWLMLIAAPALAFVAGTPVPTDSRIKTYVYNQNDVYRVMTYYGYQMNIEFGPDEEIETVSVGDKTGWQITPSEDRLFIRAMSEEGHTNMTVITSERTYQFDLYSSKPGEEGWDELVYVVRFYFPPAEGNQMATMAPPAPMMAGFPPPAQTMQPQIPQMQMPPLPRQPQMGMMPAPMMQPPMQQTQRMPPMMAPPMQMPPMMPQQQAMAPPSIGLALPPMPPMQQMTPVPSIPPFPSMGGAMNAPMPQMQMPQQQMMAARPMVPQAPRAALPPMGKTLYSPALRPVTPPNYSNPPRPPQLSAMPPLYTPALPPVAAPAMASPQAMARPAISVPPVNVTRKPFGMIAPPHMAVAPPPRMPHPRSPFVVNEMDGSAQAVARKYPQGSYKNPLLAPRMLPSLQRVLNPEEARGYTTSRIQPQSMGLPLPSTAPGGYMQF